MTMKGGVNKDLARLKSSLYVLNMEMRQVRYKVFKNSRNLEFR
jgi:hypothetical protein